MTDIVTDFILRGKDETKAAFASVKAGAEELDRRVNGLKGTFTAFTAVASSIGLVQFFASSVQESEKAERASRRLDAVLAATGRATIPGVREELDRMADSLERATLFDDDEIREAQGTLLKFGNIGTEQFERILRVSSDLASFNNTGLAPAVEAVGRALANPVEGLKQFESQIAKLTPRQREHIKELAESNRILEAQNELLAIAEGRIGGTTEKLNTGLTKAVDDAKDAWSRFKEELGGGPGKTAVEGTFRLMAIALDELTEALKRNRQGVLENPFVTGQLKPLEGLNEAADRQRAEELARTLKIPVEKALELMDQSKLEMNRKIDEINRKLKELQDRGYGQLKGTEPPGTGGENQFQTEEELERKRKKAEEEERKRREAMLKASRARQAAMQADIDFRERVDDAIRGSIEVANEQEDAASRARLKILEQQAQEENAAAERMANITKEVDEKKRAQADARRDSIADLFDSLRNEEEALEESFAQRNLLLKSHRDEMEATYRALYGAREADAEVLNQKLNENDARYYEAAKRLDREYSDQKLRIKGTETARLQLLVNQARRGEITALRGLMAEVIPLMQAKSQTLFRIGKAVALAEAIVSTHQAIANALAVRPFPLGLLLAGVAAAKGAVQIQAIRSAEIGGGAQPVFDANPATGLPTSQFPATGFEAPPSPIAQQQPVQRQSVNITLISESGQVSVGWIRDVLIPGINDALGDGVVLNVR